MPWPRLVGALVGLALLASSAAGASRPGPGAVELTGDWVLNVQASQSLVVPAPRRRQGPAEGALGDGAMAPEDSVLPDPPARRDEDGSRPSAGRRAPSWLVHPERLEAMRALLGETRSLSIVQTPTYVDLRTELGSRSLEIGVESQVSLPTGELADQRVRWQGARLVIERRVPRGVKIVETFQRLSGTDQLEVTVRRSGGPDDGLGKVELRRVFDRDSAAAASPGTDSAGALPGPRAASSEVPR